MGRPLRAAAGGIIYHTLNRANARLAIFADDGDYDAFMRVLAQGVARHDMRLLAYCMMPNHFHLLLRPRGDGDLSDFMGWVTLTHTQRWHAHHRTTGSGHLYQGRFKSFPVESDEHLLTVCRYVEQNALRAGGSKGARAAKVPGTVLEFASPTLLQASFLGEPGDQFIRIARHEGSKGARNRS